MSAHVLVVGAGLVGLVTALRLRQMGYDVEILERSAVPYRDDPRTLVLTESSVRILKAWGMAQALDDDEAVPLKSLHLSEEGTLASVRMKASEAGVEQLGVALPYSRLLESCRHQLQSSGVTVRYGVSDLNIAIAATEGRATWHHEGTLHDTVFDGMMACDGSSSSIREQLGLEWCPSAREESLLMAHFLAEEAPAEQAYERFCGESVFALIPQKKHWVLIWQGSEEQMRPYQSLDEKTLAQHIESCMRLRLGRMHCLKKSPWTLLREGSARAAFHSRVFLLGQAMLQLHPILAQGFNLALRDLALWSNLHKGHAPKAAWHEPTAQLWAERRQKDQHQTRQVIHRVQDSLKHPWGRPLRAMVWGASLLLPPVRRKIMRWGMGLERPGLAWEVQHER